MDTQRGTIERVKANGEGKEAIREGLRSCARGLTIDVPTFTIYWTNRCTSTVESMRIDGVRTASSLTVRLNSINTNGLTMLGGFLYWADSSSQALRRVNTTSGSPVMEVSQTYPTVFGGVAAVHPSKQPPGI